MGRVVWMPLWLWERVMSCRRCQRQLVWIAIECVVVVGEMGSCCVFVLLAVRFDDDLSGTFSVVCSCCRIRVGGGGLLVWQAQSDRQSKQQPWRVSRPKLHMMLRRSVSCHCQPLGTSLIHSDNAFHSIIACHADGQHNVGWESRDLPPQEKDQ